MKSLVPFFIPHRWSQASLLLAFHWVVPVMEMFPALDFILSFWSAKKNRSKSEASNTKQILLLTASMCVLPGWSSTAWTTFLAPFEERRNGLVVVNSPLNGVFSDADPDDLMHLFKSKCYVCCRSCILSPPRKVFPYVIAFNFGRMCVEWQGSARTDLRHQMMHDLSKQWTHNSCVIKLNPFIHFLLPAA